MQTGHRLSQELLEAQQRAAEAEATAVHAAADREAAQAASTAIKHQLAQLKATSAKATAEVAAVRAAAAAQSQDMRQQIAAKDRCNFLGKLSPWGAGNLP